jgi:hypothetical protein
MSVVAPNSSNENVGASGAGASTTELSAIAWATSSISLNTLQSSRLVPAIASGTSLAFSWFQSKKFRVATLHTNGYPSGYGTANTSYPDASGMTNRSFRYDTYSYVTLTATDIYPHTFSYWAYGTNSAPTSASISNSRSVSIYSTDWTSTSYFHIWAVFV